MFALALTVLDAVPASAAQIQQTGDAVQTEHAEVTESLQEELPQTVSDVQETGAEMKKEETETPEAEVPVPDEDPGNLKTAEAQSGMQEETAGTESGSEKEEKRLFLPSPSRYLGTPKAARPSDSGSLLRVRTAKASNWK